MFPKGYNATMKKWKERLEIELDKAISENSTKSLRKMIDKVNRELSRTN